MTDVLGILKGTLTGGKVKNNDFKTKVGTEITNLEGTSDLDDAKKAIVLKELLKGDTFTKIDLNSDGEISEEELNRAANIDGKPEFTIEDVRALRRVPPAKIDKSLINNLPPQLKLSMKFISIKEGGYKQPAFNKIGDNYPKGTYILPPIETKAENPLDSANPVITNFIPFVGEDGYIYIPGYEGNYNIGPDGKDNTNLFEYAFPVNELVKFAELNPKERVWIRVPGMRSSNHLFAQDKGIDISLPQIDISTEEGRAKLSKYIQKYLLLDSAGNLDTFYTNLEHVPISGYESERRTGIGAKALRENNPRPEEKQ